MRLSQLIGTLETWAPPTLQEDYDNSGLQVGDPAKEVSSALVALDCTEAVVAEAVRRKCDVIICHHPVIFRGLKSLTGRTGVERTLLAAIKYDVAVYAIHTNLDNVISGVNSEIGARLGLHELKVLQPLTGRLRKLVTFVPTAYVEAVRAALFQAGAGRIGNYDECSFGAEGAGTFRPGQGTDAFEGKVGERHTEAEIRLETIFPVERQRAVVASLLAAHPYEEVAYDVIALANDHPGIGAGAIGSLPAPVPEEEFLARLKAVFNTPMVKHTAPIGRAISRVAVCGGSGAFLVERAKAAGADAYVTADLKYHEYFGAEGQILIADIGHFESEQYTMHLIQRYLRDKLPTFAAHLTETVTNPVHIC